MLSYCQFDPHSERRTCIEEFSCSSLENFETTTIQNKTLVAHATCASGERKSHISKSAKHPSRVAMIVQVDADVAPTFKLRILGFIWAVGFQFVASTRVAAVPHGRTRYR